MYELIDLTGRHVVVIGASSGIGRKTAEVLSRLGARLTLAARRGDQLEEALSELEGGGHGCIVADASDSASLEVLVKHSVKERGRLDGLVYSVGVARSMPLKLFKPEKMRAVFDVNYFGYVEAVRQATMRGRFNEGMRIVGVSSVASFRGDKAHTAYSASKAAMDGAVRCMAKELADKGICVNNVAPAMTATAMYEGYLDKYGEDSDSNAAILERQYLGIAHPEDVANAIAFLISPAARFITGVTLPVDGGMTTS